MNHLCHWETVSLENKNRVASPHELPWKVARSNFITISLHSIIKWKVVFYNLEEHLQHSVHQNWTTDYHSSGILQYETFPSSQKLFRTDYTHFHSYYSINTMVRQTIGTFLSCITLQLLQTIMDFQRIKSEDVTKLTPSLHTHPMTTCLLRYPEGYKETQFNKMGSTTHWKNILKCSECFCNKANWTAEFKTVFKYFHFHHLVSITVKCKELSKTENEASHRKLNVHFHLDLKMKTFPPL